MSLGAPVDKFLYLCFPGLMTAFAGFMWVAFCTPAKKIGWDVLL
jgi:hypothetical protein